MEAAQDLRIDLDSELLLLDKLRVARLDAHQDPVGERLLYQSVREVDEPLTRQPLKVFRVGQVLSGQRVLLRSFENLLDPKAFVLRHRQVTDAVAVDELSLTLNERLEVVDGVALVGRQVRVTVYR